MNEQYLGTHWGIRDMRHAFIAISREHLQADAAFADVQKALADSSDHSIAVEEAHYAIKYGDVTRLTNFAMSQARWVSQQWQKVLGMSGPPLRPLRERAVFNEEDLASRINRVLEATVSARLPALLEDALQKALPAYLEKNMKASIRETGRSTFLLYQFIFLNFCIR